MIIFFLRDRIPRNYLLITMIIHLVLIFLHIIIGPIKWQMYPLYAFGILWILFMDIRISNKIINIVSASLIVIILIVSSILLYVFPLEDIPDPSGSYPIGVRDFMIEDHDRLELYTSDPTDTREFAFRMWYPAQSIDEHEIAMWMGNLALSRSLARSIGMPSFVLDQTSSIVSNSYIDAPISQQEDTYPLIIISHGWGGFMSLHTDLAEELASRGYVVVSIDHTYGSVATKLTNGIVFQNEDALPDRSEENFLNAANQLVYTYAGDVTKTLDYLEEENEMTSDTFFKGKLDLEHIGLIGHSTGGGADVAVAINDLRIKALLGLDAWVEPIEMVEIEKGLTMPSIFLRSETWEEGYNNEHLYELIRHSPEVNLYQINGTTHSDFSMAYMFSPLTGMIGYTGSLDKIYLLNMQKAMMNTFFDEHLKGMIDQEFNASLYEELTEINVT